MQLTFLEKLGINYSKPVNLQLKLAYYRLSVKGNYNYTTFLHYLVRINSFAVYVTLPCFKVSKLWLLTYLSFRHVPVYMTGDQRPARNGVLDLDELLFRSDKEVDKILKSLGVPPEVFRSLRGCAQLTRFLRTYRIQGYVKYTYVSANNDQTLSYLLFIAWAPSLLISKSISYSTS